ncbi:hypothetical protein JG687_00001537 [Phytophthora cactorum]|uniref:Uncharacterized protein n=1 Tax=Phytophthora cactorum TaxID=29920 RepID=A0A8T1V1N8_9STRA|nr:hypothetical protein JG687_00001537 [Phytophthora cactorum]
METMGIAFLLDHTKKPADFVDADLADSISALKTLSERLRISTTEAQKNQFGDEANSLQTLKHHWSSDTGGSDDADDDESKSEDGSVAGSSDDFSPSSMSRQDDFNVFSYDGSEEQKEST